MANGSKKRSRKNAAKHQNYGPKTAETYMYEYRQATLVARARAEEAESKVTDQAARLRLLEKSGHEAAGA